MEKETAAPTAAELEAFQALLQRIQLRDVQLLAASVHAERGYIAAHGAVDGGVEVGLDVGGTGRIANVPRRLECDMRLVWRGFLRGSDEPLVTVEEVYLVTYDLQGEDPVPDGALRAFTDHNAAFNVWPFFRESLHSMTLRMGLPAYTLPLLKPTAQR